MMKNNFLMMMLLCSLFSIEGMESQLITRELYATCRKIDQQHDREAKKFKMKTITSADGYTSISILEKELKAYKKKITIRRKSILKKFKDHYAIHDSAWNDCLDIAKNIHVLNRKNKTISSTTITSDENFPRDACYMIKKALDKRRISRNRVHLSTIEGAPIYGVNVNVVVEKDEKGILALNVAQWKNVASELKNFVCISMIEEFAEILSIMPKLIILLWQDMAPVVRLDPNDLRELQNAARVLSLLSATLRNPTTASLIKKYVYTISNIDFTVDDYCFISGIEWRLRAHQNLKKIFYCARKEKMKLLVCEHTSECEHDESEKNKD